MIYWKAGGHPSSVGMAVSFSVAEIGQRLLVFDRMERIEYIQREADNQLQAGQSDNGGLRRMNTKERAIKLIHEGPPSSAFLRDNSTWR
jgi:hypothetical protein